jgi:hypothetical protein
MMPVVRDELVRVDRHRRLPARAAARRAVTGKLTVVKFRCHYHGWSDAIHLATDRRATARPPAARIPTRCATSSCSTGASLEALCALDPREVAGGDHGARRDQRRLLRAALAIPARRRANGRRPTASCSSSTR